MSYKIIIVLRDGQADSKYYLINDGQIETLDKTPNYDQYDIVINENGVFVIETKNYSGRIYGQENQHEWTQVLSYFKR